MLDYKQKAKIKLREPNTSSETSATSDGTLSRAESAKAFELNIEEELRLVPYQSSVGPIRQARGNRNAAAQLTELRAAKRKEEEWAFQMLEQKPLENYRKAAEYQRKLRTYARSLIKPNLNLRKFVVNVE